MSTIIIFGLSSPGLFLLRELSIKGNNVIGIARKNDFGRFSKYGVKYIAHTEKELKEVLGKIINQCGEKPEGIIASAYYLTLIVNKMPELFDLICMNGPDIDILRIFDDKINTYNYLNELGIPVPRTFKISEVNNIAEEEFPLIIKWRSTELDFSKRTIEKTRIVRNNIELLCVIRGIDISNTKLIVQKYIYGEDIEEYGYGGYFENGKEKADIWVNGLRQFPIGIYTFAREVEDNKLTRAIKSQLTNMLKTINYTGFIHFDIVVDRAHGKFWILDINPRPWNSMTILKKKYLNFIEVLSSKDNELTKNINIIQWIDLFSDFLSIIKHSIKSKSIISIIKDYREYFKYSTIYNVFQYNDIKPILGWLWASANVLCKYLMNKIKNL